MPNKIRRSPRARLDLIDIWTYIAQDNTNAADGLLDRFDEVIGRLAERPLMGRKRSELGEAFRSFPVGNYVIFYLPKDEGVEIIRVLSGYRDIDAQDVTDENP
jgi:toxin ParE1/3/4